MLNLHVDPDFRSSASVLVEKLVGKEAELFASQFDRGFNLLNWFCLPVLLRRGRLLCISKL